MKKHTQSILFLLIAALLISVSACSDSDQSPAPEPVWNSIEVEVGDGATFQLSELVEESLPHEFKYVIDFTSPTGGKYVVESIKYIEDAPLYTVGDPIRIADSEREIFPEIFVSLNNDNKLIIRWDENILKKNKIHYPGG